LASRGGRFDGPFVPEPWGSRTQSWGRRSSTSHPGRSMSLPRPRPHRAPRHRSPAAVLSILACLSSLIFGADDATESATSKSRPETATVTLVEDQALVGELIDATIQVDTKYGKLSIPTEDI